MLDARENSVFSLLGRGSGFERSTGGPLTIPADQQALLRIADMKLEFVGKERNDNVTV